MTFSALFIRRPIATVLLSAGLLLAGIVAYFQLPVASLPNVDMPTLRVMRGTARRRSRKPWRPPSPRRWNAASAKSPALRKLTSTSQLGSTSINVQFDV